jgi:hypothetical protein
MAISRKIKIGVLVGLGLIVVVGGWQGIYYLTRVGYSNGTRTGLVRKVSKKGPPGCKYYEGEMALQGARLDEHPFTFSVDEDKDTNPIIAELQKAEREGARVTLHYRQDRPVWWRICNPNEYFIERVEK